MLALGTLFGTFYGQVALNLDPTLNIAPGMFAIAGMGALFAATVRAPITGILLVIEMTNNYHLILPLIITTLGATIVAQLLGGQPIYTQLLHRTLKKTSYNKAIFHNKTPRLQTTKKANLKQKMLNHKQNCTKYKQP